MRILLPCGEPRGRFPPVARTEAAIRRRRECEKCFRRFTTFEKADTVPLMVIKKDKTRRARLTRTSCARASSRPARSARFRRQKIDEARATKSNGARIGRPKQEITSKAIGEMVMESLRKLDEVAYVRFASRLSPVPRSFRRSWTSLDRLDRVKTRETLTMTVR